MNVHTGAISLAMLILLTTSCTDQAVAPKRTNVFGAQAGVRLDWSPGDPEEYEGPFENEGDEIDIDPQAGDSEDWIDGVGYGCPQVLLTAVPYWITVGAVGNTLFSFQPPLTRVAYIPGNPPICKFTVQPTLSAVRPDGTQWWTSDGVLSVQSRMIKVGSIWTGRVKPIAFVGQIRKAP